VSDHKYCNVPVYIHDIHDCMLAYNESAACQDVCVCVLLEHSGGQANSLQIAIHMHVFFMTWLLTTCCAAPPKCPTVRLKSCTAQVSHRVNKQHEPVTSHMLLAIPMLSSACIIQITPCQPLIIIQSFDHRAHMMLIGLCTLHDCSQHDPII
jgi:hypothetical protein